MLRKLDNIDELMLPNGVNICEYASISNEELMEHVERVGMNFTGQV